MSCDQLGFKLSYGVDGNSYNNEQHGTAEIHILKLR